MEASPPALYQPDVAEERALALWLLCFFSIKNSRLTVNSSGGETAVPRTLGEAWSALREAPDLAFARKFIHLPLVLHRLAQRLAAANFLTPAGTGRGSPPLHACYYTDVARTQLQLRGEAWLTAALGWEHLLQLTRPLICRVSGRSSTGASRCGTGVLLTSSHVLTNKHVVADMRVESVEVGEQEYGYELIREHSTHDVAVIQLREPAPYEDAGLAWRAHRPLEQVMTAGYVPIPTIYETPLVAQLGETCIAGTVRQLDGAPCMLFTAISRPGNSGGPVFAADGRVIGLISQSFEREAEEGELSPPFPHYAAVPAMAVRDAVAELAPQLEFPWENWAQ